jgi:P27 family predicted phage terminase small subunit
MKGRKPDSNLLQEAKGNPGKRKAPAVPRANYAHVAVVAPAWLKRSRAAMQVWSEISPLLIQINLLSNIDVPPFARYCRYVAEWMTADKAIAKEGMYYDTVTTEGHPKKSLHPAWVIRSKLEAFLTAIEVRFGIGPHDRYKILRDQAALTDGLALWQAMAAKEQVAEQDKQPAPADIDPLGALNQFDLHAPGTRPN